MNAAIAIDPERLAEIARLDAGGHTKAEHKFCIMEAVAHVAREPWSDHPACASRTISRFSMRLNDRWDEEERQLLLPYLARIAGSRASREVERRRGYVAATYACKVFVPLALDVCGLGEQAAQLRTLPDIIDQKTARGAQKAADAAAYAAYAAYAAAAADADTAAYAAYAADAGADAAAYAAYAAAAADADTAAADTADAARKAAVDAALACLDAMLSIGDAA